MITVFVFADYSHGIVMPPVHGKVAKGRHLPVVLISCRSAYGQGQGIGGVVRIQGNAHALAAVFSSDPVIACIHAGSIIHAVVSHTQPHRVLASGKIACHVDDMAGILRRTVHFAGRDAAACCVSIPVAGNGYNIVLVQIVKGKGTHAAKGLLADADARRHGYDIRVHVRRGFYRTRC